MRAGIFRVLAMMLVLPLAAMVSGCGNPVGEGHNIRRATGVVITDLQNNTLVTTEGAGAAGWLGAPLTLQVGQELPVRIFFINPAGERFQLPLSGAEHTLRVDFAPASIATYEGQAEQQGVFRGLAAGAGTATIHIRHGAHADYSTNPALPVVVNP